MVVPSVAVDVVDHFHWVEQSPYPFFNNEPVRHCGFAMRGPQRFSRYSNMSHRNPAYCDVIVQRLRQGSLLAPEVA